MTIFAPNSRRTRMIQLPNTLWSGVSTRAPFSSCQIIVGAGGSSPERMDYPTIAF
jgi:hypothetical protein